MVLHDGHFMVLVHDIFLEKNNNGQLEVMNKLKK